MNRPRLLTRRSFVSGLLASATIPVWAQNIPANPDVVIIGAGSAGLAAARTIIAAGKPISTEVAALRGSYFPVAANQPNTVAAPIPSTAMMSAPIYGSRPKSSNMLELQNVIILTFITQA